MNNSSGKYQKPTPKLLPRPVRSGQWNGKDLPIWEDQNRIISAVLKYPIIVLTAPPGIGKSTQLPIMMLEAGYKKIILVVPKVIVAQQLAHTISSLLDHTKKYGKDKEVGLATGEVSAYNFANNKVLVMTSGFAIACNLMSKLTKEHLLILDEDAISQSLNNLKAIDCVDESGTITDIGYAVTRLGLSPSASRIVLEAMALFPALKDHALKCMSALRQPYFQFIHRNRALVDCCYKVDCYDKY